MDYTVRREAGYLLVNLSGAPSEPDIRAMLREMVAASAGMRGALMEVGITAGLNLTATKDLVVELPRMGFPAGFRIAALLLDEAARKSAEFAEDVAFNRGIGLRVFHDRAAALGWLAG